MKLMMNQLLLHLNLLALLLITTTVLISRLDQIFLVLLGLDTLLRSKTKKYLLSHGLVSRMNVTCFRLFALLLFVFAAFRAELLRVLSLGTFLSSLIRARMLSFVGTKTLMVGMNFMMLLVIILKMILKLRLNMILINE